MNLPISDIFSLFQKGEKWCILVVFLTLILLSILEATGIYILAVVAGLLIGKNIVELTPELFSRFLEPFSNNDLLVLFVSFFFLKGVMFLISQNKIYGFLYRKYSNIASELVIEYTSRSYKEFTKFPPSVYHRNINSDSFWVIANVIIPFFNMLVEVLLIAILLSYLTIAFFEEINFLYLLLAPIIFKLILIHKKYVKRRGEESQNRLGEINRITREILNNFKFIKVGHLYPFTKAMVEDSVRAYGRNSAFLKVIAQLPRHIFEFLAIFSIAIFSITNKSEIVYSSSSGFLLIGLIRSLPSLNRIMSDFTMISYYQPSLKVINNDLKNAEKRKKIINQNPIDIKVSSLNLKDVCFSYDGLENMMLRNINLEFKLGRLYVIKGLSGSGKTTLVNILAGLLEPVSGSIFINNREINLYNENISQIISYTPQDVILNKGTLKENIEFGNTSNEKLLSKAIYASCIDDMERKLELSFNLDESANSLSGGEKQRVSIARSLYKNNQIMIFDESTSALDIKTQREVIDRIKAEYKDTILIFVAHRPEIYDLADEIIEINKG